MIRANHQIHIQYLSKEEWYTGVGELFGLCFWCLWDKLPIKAEINILFNAEKRGHKLASFDRLFMWIPDFESESVEYLLPSGLPSLKSANGFLLPVGEFGDKGWHSCLTPAICAPLGCGDVCVGVRPAGCFSLEHNSLYLIIGLRRNLIPELA